MNFYLKIKLTVNWSGFWLSEPNIAIWNTNGQENLIRLCEPHIHNLKSKWPREIAQAQSLTTAFIDIWHLNNQEILHKLKIWTASSKNRKMNFHLKMKLTVNAGWFWLCELNISNLKSKWSREIAQAQVLKTELRERNLLPEINIYFKILP